MKSLSVRFLSGFEDIHSLDKIFNKFLFSNIRTFYLSTYIFRTRFDTYLQFDLKETIKHASDDIIFFVENSIEIPTFPILDYQTNKFIYLKLNKNNISKYNQLINSGYLNLLHKYLQNVQLDTCHLIELNQRYLLKLNAFYTILSLSYKEIKIYET